MKKRINVYVLIGIIIIYLIIKIPSWYWSYSGNTEFENAFRNTNDLIITKHARCRMGCRHITINEIKEIIKEGKINQSKSRRGSEGDQTFALEGISAQDDQHIRVIVAPENNGLVIITCIDLEKDWPCNCK